MQGQLDPIQLMQKIAELENKINALRTIEVGGVWQDWTPNYTQYGSMTYTGITTHTARYSKIGNLCYFKIDSAGTLGGTLGPIIYFSSPVTPNPAFTGIGFSFSLGVVIGGVLIAGLGSSNSTGGVFYTSKIDKSNFNAGAIRFVGYGFYEIA